MTPDRPARSVVATIRRARDALAAIATWWPRTATPPRPEHSQVRRPYGPRPPAAVDVVSLRRDVTDHLAALAREVAEERDLWPALNTTDVVATATWLGLHHEWIATASADPDYTTDQLAYHARRLQQIALGERARLVHLRADCPRCDRGRLVSSVPPGSDMIGSTIWCDHGPCAAQWDIHEARAVWRAVRATYGPSLRRPGDTPDPRHAVA